MSLCGYRDFVGFLCLAVPELASPWRTSSNFLPLLYNGDDDYYYSTRRGYHTTFPVSLMQFWEIAFLRQSETNRGTEDRVNDGWKIKRGYQTPVTIGLLRLAPSKRITLDKNSRLKIYQLFAYSLQYSPNYASTEGFSPRRHIVVQPPPEKYNI